MNSDPKVTAEDMRKAMALLDTVKVPVEKFPPSEAFLREARIDAIAEALAQTRQEAYAAGFRKAKEMVEDIISRTCKPHYCDDCECEMWPHGTVEAIREMQPGEE